MQSCLELRCIGVRCDAIPLSRCAKCRKEIRQLSQPSSSEQGQFAGFDVPEKRDKRISEQSVRNSSLDRVCATDYNLPAVMLRSLGGRCKQMRFSNTAFPGDDESCPGAFR